MPCRIFTTGQRRICATRRRSAVGRSRPRLDLTTGDQYGEEGKSLKISGWHNPKAGKTYAVVEWRCLLSLIARSLNRSNRDVEMLQRAGLQLLAEAGRVKLVEGAQTVADHTESSLSPNVGRGCIAHCFEPV